MSNTLKKQRWIHSPSFDGLYILLPSFLALLITIILPEQYKNTSEMPLVAWVVLVLLIDVSHVYSTLFLTYWNKKNFSKHRRLYLLVPALCYIVGVLLYSYDGLLFWRSIAYLAVFHFVRQQYGFMRLYARFDKDVKWWQVLDKVMIYAATLYPIVFWHTTAGRNFSWFVEGDFVVANLFVLRMVATYLYVVIIITYLVKELVRFKRLGELNVPKNVLIVGTALSWYFGIVYFNGDMAFTLLNVVAHGIPYIALVWLFSNKGKQQAIEKKSTKRFLVLFLSVIVLLAYFEEGLWDGLVWKEHTDVFTLFQSLPFISNKYLLALIVPLLSLPQTTHYVLDGYIWKRGHMVS